MPSRGLTWPPGDDCASASARPGASVGFPWPSSCAQAPPLGLVGNKLMVNTFDDVIAKCQPGAAVVDDHIWASPLLGYVNPADNKCGTGSGNIGIAAHRDTYFRPLRLIRVNDVIEMKTPAGESRYAVTETKVVHPSDIGVLARAPGRDLTLVTCYPFYYIGSAPERFIVHARKVG